MNTINTTSTLSTRAKIAAFIGLSGAGAGAGILAAKATMGALGSTAVVVTEGAVVAEVGAAAFALPAAVGTAATAAFTVAAPILAATAAATAVIYGGWKGVNYAAGKYADYKASKEAKAATPAATAPVEAAVTGDAGLSAA